MTNQKFHNNTMFHCFVTATAKVLLNYLIEIVSVSW